MMLASAANTSPPTRPSSIAAANDTLKQLPEQIAFPKASVAVLGEGRLIGNGIAQVQTTEPAIGQVQMNFHTQPPFRPDTHDIADQKHSDHQFRVNRRTADVAIERSKMCSDAGQVDKSIH